MRYGILALCLLLVAAAGCNKKTTIDPSRYGRGPAVQQSNDSLPPPPAAPVAQDAQVGEKDLQPAPSVAQTPRTETPLPVPKRAPQPAQQPAPQPVEQPAPREVVIYQVGVFSDVANATALKSKLDQASFETSLERDISLPQPVYRVTAKWYGSDPEGRARLQDAGVFDAILLGGSQRPAPSPALRNAPAVSDASLLGFQVGVFSDPVNAARLRDKLDAQGVRVDTPEEVVDGRTYYKVIALVPGPQSEARGRLAMLGFPDPIFLPSAAADTAVPVNTPANAPGDVHAPLASFQVGAFSDVANAEALRSRLNAAGFSSDVELITREGGNRYRVVATGSGSPAEVEASLRQLGVQKPLLLHR